jgi:hypothetical protein
VSHISIISLLILSYLSRFSPPTQKSDMLYSSNVTELDPPKCVVCMVRFMNKSIQEKHFIFSI